MAEEQKASVGRLVHYREPMRCHAAIIAEVHDAKEEIPETVSLWVFESKGVLSFKPHTAYSERRNIGAWHWPERV